MKTSFLSFGLNRLHFAATLAVASVVHAQSITDESPAPAAPTALTAKEIAQGFSDRVVLAKPRAQHRVTAEAAETRERVRVRRTFARFGDLRVIELDGTETVAAAIARLQATGRYEFVEPSYIQKPSAIPNDPTFFAQWHLNNTGQNIGAGAGTPGADIKAPAAWDVINDASGVIVAIVDTGARLNHPEIAPNLWRNPSPTFGDVHGARFTSGTGVPTNGDPTDDDGHGTRMAGFIGGAGNNNVLFTGVAWRVQMMILKNGFDAAGNFLAADTIACFDYAIRHGAKIINCSFGNFTYSEAIFTAMKAARDAGVIFVCGAGNNGVDSDARPFYPAGYALDNIVNVGMTDNTDAVSSRSNFGANVDLFAPGVSVPALNWANDTGVTVVTGTSPATAFGSGSLALLKARFPGDTYRQLINRLLRSTDRKPAFLGKVQSGGRLNLFNAVTSTSNRPMNDDFATRAILSGNLATLRSNNAGATTETGESAHAGTPAAATLWWEWTAPATAPVTIDTAGSEYDTVLAVYTGTTLGALTATAANDDATGRTTSRVTFNAQAGVSYLFAVGSKGAATGLTLINLTPAPPNEPVTPAPTPAVIARQPNAQTISAGGTAVFSVTATGATSYQWKLNNTAIAGATSATLVVRNATAASAGNYAVDVISGAGTTTSTAASLTVSTNPDFGRIINLSILTDITAAAPLFTVGASIGGAGTSGGKALLVRAVGPSLAQLGVPGPIDDPKLEVFSGQLSASANDNWGGDSALANAFASVGAFAYLNGTSRDAATFNPTTAIGSYTIQVSGVNGATGAVIAELYDSTPGASFVAGTPRLVNVSVLKTIPAGGLLTAGFSIGGSTAKTVLVRVIGPRLGLVPFSIGDAMPDPKLELFSGQTVIASSDNWGGDAQLTAVGTAVGAFAVTDPASRDAILLITLPPGNYTAQATPVTGTPGGVAIVEVYEVP